MTVQATYRAAVMDLLQDCADNANVQIQLYRGRPKSIYPPTGFIDSMHDELDNPVGALFQHHPRIVVVLVWGLYDSGAAVDQRDAFVDAFHDWVRSNYHAAGSASLIAPTSLDDEPTFVPDWLPEEQQIPHFATRIELEGFVTD